MGRGKDLWLEQTGGMRFGETAVQLKARVAEIEKLEKDLKSGRVKGDNIEKVMRRPCQLKGIDFDSYDDPHD